MRSFFAVALALFLGVAPASATSTNQFSVRTPVGDDVSPPTTPTLLTATPIAPTQIDLTWTPSTDDFELLGYTVSRDGLHIATTTLTTYADTGLSASTTYAYTVRAFDWLYNVSSSSNELSTTTPNPPAPPPPEPAPTSTGAVASGKLMLSGAVRVTPAITSATFMWSTSRPSRFALRWGRTTSYELGYITADRFRENHETTITDLLPGTTYYYEVIGFNTLNDIPQPIGSGRFTTRSPVEATAPPNVANLEAVADGVTARLSWDNPPLLEGGYAIRIVRNHLGYPLDPYDGMVVYQGIGTSHVDGSAFVRQSQQYYTVYVIDREGRWSSGALALVSAVPRAAGYPDPLLPPATPTGVPTLPPDVVLTTLSFADIVVMQAGVRFDFTAPTIALSAQEPFSLAIAKEHLPSRLKSIIVTLLDPTDYTRAHRFLLRLNDAGTAYESTLPPLRVTGISQLLIEVYDLEAMVVGRYGKQVAFVAGTPGTQPVVFPDVLFTTPLVPLAGVAVGVLSGLLLLVAWRRREDNR